MHEDRDEIFDSKITLHDKHRFEIKLDLELASAEHTVYELESYFFVPRALNIGPTTYTKEDFYNNNQRYIRFKTPKISLSKICDPSLAASPLNRIKENLSKILSASNDPKLVELVYDEFKMLGCVIRGEIRDFVHLFGAELRISQAESVNGAKPLAGNGLLTFLLEYKTLAAQIFALKTDISRPAIPLKLRDAYAFFDEYFSLMTEEYLTILLAEMRDSPLAAAQLKSAEDELADLIIAQGKYRALMNYPSVLKSGESNEVLIYRRGVLKKFISSALYLKTEVDEWQTLTQILMGLAAGLAMLFAALAAIYAQNRYTMNSVPFVLIIVVSYIFKDRIKDWLKLLFSRNFTRMFSDREIFILDPENLKKIGVLKETFSFISTSAVPPDIERLRKIDNFTSIDEDGKPERVFKYKKEIALYPKKILKAHERRRALNDIMRFNIKDFITQADDSNVAFQYVDPQTGLLRTTNCSRVYHMNMLVKYSYADAKGQAKVHYDRIRIVLNKEGLVRLEEVKLS